jgi:hypothetical protein
MAILNDECQLGALFGILFFKSLSRWMFFSSKAKEEILKSPEFFAQQLGSKGPLLC